jgi:hypothetical protein
MRLIDRMRLRLRGIDPKELEAELKQMDEAKARREHERQGADEAARRRYVDMRMRKGEEWRQK